MCIELILSVFRWFWQFGLLLFFEMFRPVDSLRLCLSRGRSSARLPSHRVQREHYRCSAGVWTIFPDVGRFEQNEESENWDTQRALEMEETTFVMDVSVVVFCGKSISYLFSFTNIVLVIQESW